MAFAGVKALVRQQRLVLFFRMTVPLPLVT
jgi:hypothetical protein